MSVNDQQQPSSEGFVFVSGLNKERKKRFTHKTRHGCNTCKKRRVKCDEGKPTCAQCARSGRRCEGYRGAVLEELNSTSTEISPQMTQMKISIMPFQYRFGDPSETLFFESYFRITAVELAKFCNPYVWFTLVPQMSVAHDCVKQALFAVAVACEESTHSPTRGLTRSKALWHYNESIRALTRMTKAAASGSTDVVLMCSLLFWLFENLKNRPYVAIAHLKGAVDILNERALLPKYRDDIPTTYVEPLLKESLNLAGIGYEVKTKPRGSAAGPTRRDEQLQALLAKLELNSEPKDIHAARLDFARLQDAYNTAMQTQELPSADNLKLLLELHKRFKSVLNTYRDEWDQDYLRLLHLHCDMHIMGIEKHLNCMYVEKETTAQPDRVRLMGLLEEARFFARREIIKGDNSIQMSVIAILTAIVKNCSESDDDIATEALDILDKYEIFEGIWSSRVAGKVARLMRYDGDKPVDAGKQGDLDLAFKRALCLQSCK